MENLTKQGEQPSNSIEDPMNPFELDQEKVKELVVNLGQTGTERHLTEKAAKMIKDAVQKALDSE